MHRRPSLFVFLAAALFVALILVTAQGRPALAQLSSEERLKELQPTALALVAAQNSLTAESLLVDNAGVAELPYSGRTAYSFKIDDAATGERYTISLDENGYAVDLNQWVADEAAAYDAFYGGLDPMLAEYLLAAKEGEQVPVIIWLKEPEYTPPDRPEPPAVTPTESDLEQPGPDQAVAEQAAANYLVLAESQRAAAVSLVTAPVVSRLGALGVQVQADTVAPMIAASLTWQQILDVAAWEEVDIVYLDGVAEPTLTVARATIFGTTVHDRGITGSGVRVAEIEVGGRIHNHPNLAGTVIDTFYSCVDPHTTHVAGIIRSTHAIQRGIAPDVLLRVGGSCEGIESQLLSRSTAANGWGAFVFNLSFGKDTNRNLSAADRYYDDLVRNSSRSVIVSAGNRGAAGCDQGTDGDVGSPGLAYNVITVGNFNDRNTTGWSDDLMDPCSSWRDPISMFGDREKPEVAAPGTNIHSTISDSSFGTLSGTSMAAPMVAGGAALLIRRDLNLTTWPEAVKAILMASAVHNIEGNARLSEFDGAGGIELARADDIARHLRGSWGGVNYSCTRPTNYNVGTMSLTAGKKTRVVIAWDTPTSLIYSSYYLQPSADLDLRILNSSGSLVSSSSTFDNTYEIVSFVPATSGTYTIQVHKSRCDSSPGFLGWAWTRDQ